MEPSEHMDKLAHVDVVIVGGGWTGLVMAKEIATRTPQSVVVLERGGPARTNEEYAAGMDEVDGLIRLRYMQNIAEQSITHRHSPNSRTKPIRQLGGGGASFATGVGGSGELWSAVVCRFLPEQFTLATHLREKYGRDRLPPDLTVQDWGLTYDELEPYYWRAEQMMGVGGKAGNLRGKLITGGNIFEGPRSHEYVNPPHPMPYFATLFEKAAQDLGYHPYPQPSANLTRPYRNPDGVERPACEYCGHCGFFGCMVGAKATPTTTMLPVLKGRKNFTLRTNSWVRRVIHQEGKALGVSYIDASGKEVMQPADVVVIAAWTLNAVGLLLLSGIGETYDPETGKGTLGKNLTQHVLHGTQVFFEKSLNGFMGGGGVGVAISDFAGDPPDADVAAGVFRGGVVRTILGGQTPIQAFGAIPHGVVNSNWGSEWKKAGLEWYDKQAALSLAAAHFATRRNFIDLDPTYTDKFGDSLVRITLDWTDHDRREAAMIARVEESLAKAMGAKAFNRIQVVGEHYDIAHSTEPNTYGGAIMGSSPETSVVNPWLQHWAMPNLWVVGGSCFPQSEVQGTLTILAVTYRAADALVDRYLKQPGALA
jgi:gluconate 2-dehydrogenase alpha chain